MHWFRVVHHVLKTLAYASCAVGCLYQCASILKIYFSFPSTVTSTVEVMNTLTLPAITICNNNRVMLSKLKAADPSFASRWDELVARLRKRVQAVQHLLDQTVRNLMDTLSVNEFATLGLNWTDLIPPDHFKCATDPYNLNNKCLKYANIIESAQEEGNCFTIFSRSDDDFLKRLAVKSGLGQSPVIHGGGSSDSLNLEISEQPFHPNEVFRMMVNFSIRDYTTLNEKVVGQLLVHDENEVPAIRQRSYLIYPGFYYEFYVTKETDKYLPHPYETDCMRYDVAGVSDQGHYLPSVLSRESCIFDCLASKTVQVCGCWPPELPYVLSNSSTEHSLKWCSWRDGVNVNVSSVSTVGSNNTNWFRHCFSRFEPHCSNQCKIQCEVDKYTTLRQSFVWPSNERMDHSTKYNKEFRQCCSIVSLRFWSAEQTTLKYEPKYAFVEFSSYFGGLLSSYLGFSLVKTYDIAELVLRKIFQRYRSGKGLVWPFRQPTDATKTGATRPRVAKYYKTKHMHNTSI